MAGHRLREHLAGDPSDSGGREALNTAWSVLREMGHRGNERGRGRISPERKATEIAGEAWSLSGPKMESSIFYCQGNDLFPWQPAPQPGRGCFSDSTAPTGS